jgi:hypothetical protein
MCRLVKRLADVEADGRINYTRFLDRYRIEMTGSSAHWQDAVIDHICEKIFFALKGRGTTVSDAFSIFDVDHNGKRANPATQITLRSFLLPSRPSRSIPVRASPVCCLHCCGSGTIEYEEFVNTLKTMDVGLSEAQIYELMRGMDKNKDTVIDLEEFTSRFGVIFTGYVDREAVRHPTTIHRHCPMPMCGGPRGDERPHGQIERGVFPGPAFDSIYVLLLTQQEKSVRGLSEADGVMLAVSGPTASLAPARLHQPWPHLVSGEALRGIDACSVCFVCPTATR